MKTKIALGKLLLILVIASMAVNISLLVDSQKEVNEASNRRYTSYVLADMLRQSSDDLTRLARTYVITGDAKYEEMYNTILDIRNGKVAMPEHYERIYWDLYSVDKKKPRPDSNQKVALQDLMKQVGFTDVEFAKLKEAQNNSNKLVDTEVIAMNAVKGIVPDQARKMMREGETPFTFAYRIMHDESYHQEKAKIMAPINDFFAMFDERTAKAVQKSEQTQSTYIHSLIILFIVLVLVIVVDFLISVTILRPMDQLIKSDAARIAKFDLTGRVAEHLLKRKDEIGDLARSFQQIVDHLRDAVKQVVDSSNQVQQAAHALTDISHQASESAIEVSQIIEEIANGASHQARHTEQGTESVSQLDIYAGQNIEEVHTLEEVAQQVNQ